MTSSYLLSNYLFALLQVALSSMCFVVFLIFVQKVASANFFVDGCRRGTTSYDNKPVTEFTFVSYSTNEYLDYEYF